MRLKLNCVALALAFVMLAGVGGALVSRTSQTKASAAAVAAAVSYVGTWQTTWKNSDGSSGAAPIMVKADSVNARALDGMVEMKGPNGVMYGSLSADGKTWSGDWWNSNGEKGTFTFTLKGNKTFEGSYTLSGVSGNLVWNGTRK